MLDIPLILENIREGIATISDMDELCRYINLLVEQVARYRKQRDNLRFVVADMVDELRGHREHIASIVTDFGVCPQCGSKNYHLYSPESEAYICDDCGFVFGVPDVRNYPDP